MTGGSGRPGPRRPRAERGARHPRSATGAARLARLVAPGLVALVAGCADRGPGGDPSLVLRVSVSPTPAPVGPARILLALSDTAGRPVGGAELVVTGLMSHAGMAPVVDTAAELEPGRYVAADFPFSMAGDWVLEARGRLPDGRLAAADQRILVVGGGPGGGDRGEPGRR